LKKHLTPSTVISCIALFVALSGAAYAATLGKNAVKTKNIANGAVTAAKVKNSSITAAKIANGAVIGSKIANGAVGQAKLADASVRSNALGGGVVTTGKIKDLGVTDAKLNSNAVTATKIAANAVETGKLANEAVTGTKMSATLLGQLVKNVSYVPDKSIVNSAPASKGATATCPTGKVVIGGGARIVGTEVTKVVLVTSAPKTDAAGKATAWEASATPFDVEPKEWAVEAHAICAEL
jgi:hypothetical protein